VTLNIRKILFDTSGLIRETRQQNNSRRALSQVSWLNAERSRGNRYHGLTEAQRQNSKFFISFEITQSHVQY